MLKIKQIIYLLLTLALLPKASIATEQYCALNALYTTPTEHFTNNGDGTVTDKTTGLMWQHCLDGLSGNDCLSGALKTYTWAQALQRAENLNNNGGFANYVDWRVPNIKELITLTERGCTTPAINLTLFPNIWTGSDTSPTWSSTPYNGTLFSREYIYTVRFINGVTGPYWNNSYEALRLVRTATPIN